MAWATMDQEIEANARSLSQRPASTWLSQQDPPVPTDESQRDTHANRHTVRKCVLISSISERKRRAVHEVAGGLPRESTCSVAQI